VTTRPIYERNNGDALLISSVSKKKYKSLGNITTFPFGKVIGKF
jgi:hypothetical protein